MQKENHSKSDIAIQSVSERVQRLEEKLSPQQIAVAHRFIQTLDLLQACKDTTDITNKNTLYSYRYRLSKDTAFMQYVHILREMQGKEVLIDHRIILNKLQKELMQSSGKTSAELAKVINQMQGNSIDRKEITIRMPDLQRDQLESKPERPALDRKDSTQSIEESKEEFNKLLENVQDAEYQEVNE